jgi:hypothetical protein
MRGEQKRERRGNFAEGLGWGGKVKLALAITGAAERDRRERRGRERPDPPHKNPYPKTAVHGPGEKRKKGRRDGVEVSGILSLTTWQPYAYINFGVTAWFG